MALLFVICAGLVTPGSLLAHEEAAGLLHILDHRIQVAPGQAKLHLERARLYASDAQWDAALADLVEAARLDPAFQRTAVRCSAMVYLERGDLAQALAMSRAVLEDDPDDGTMWLVRARALAAGNRRADARLALDEALRNLDQVSPELEIARAELVAWEGPAATREAVRRLDEIMARQGWLVTLETVALELELSIGEYDHAIARLDRTIRRVRRPERWLAWRGDILARSGHCEAAAESYRAAVRALDALPARHRQTRSAQSLRESTLAALAGLPRNSEAFEEERAE